jgi:hypothetical protein
VQKRIAEGRDAQIAAVALHPLRSAPTAQNQRQGRGQQGRDQEAGGELARGVHHPVQHGGVVRGGDRHRHRHTGQREQSPEAIRVAQDPRQRGSGCGRCRDRVPRCHAASFSRVSAARKARLRVTPAGSVPPRAPGTGSSSRRALAAAKVAERFRHQVIDRGERNAQIDEPPHPAGELGLVRHAEGQLVQAGMNPGGGTGGARGDHHQRPVRGAERHAGPRIVASDEAGDVGPERLGAVEVGHRHGRRPPRSAVREGRPLHVAGPRRGQGGHFAFPAPRIRHGVRWGPCGHGPRGRRRPARRRSG